MEQIGRSISGQVKLGQHQRTNAAFGGLANSRQRNLGIALDIGNANLRRRRRHTQKAIVLDPIVQIIVHASSNISTRRNNRR